MSRTTLAVPFGLFGFAAYVAVVVALADHVMQLHWMVQAAFFLVAGIVWAWPAKWLMFWAAGQRQP